MFDLRKTILSHMICIRQWHNNLRMPLAFVTLIILSALCGGMYISTIWNTGNRLCAFEPFIAIFHDYRLSLAAMGTLLLINMDTPFFNANDALYIFRLGRFNWALGRIIYCSAIGFILPFLLALTVTVLLSPFTFLYNEWSPAIVALSRNMDAFRSPGIVYYFPPVITWDIITTTKPVTAILWVCTLLGLFNASLTVLMMTLSMTYSRIIGTGFCLALILSGPFTEFMGNWSVYANGVLSLHKLTDNEMTKNFPSLNQSILFFMLILVIASVAMLIRTSKHGFKWGE